MSGSAGASSEFHSTGVRGEWPSHTGNWGRWDNDRGTLNLIDAAAVLRGVAAVRTGAVVTCGRAIDPDNGTDQWTESPASTQTMLRADSTGFEQGQMTQVSYDDWTVRTHGMTNTHIDALCHIGYRGRTFGGHPFDDVVSMAEGAKKFDATELTGIVTRGMLIDVPRNRGALVEPGTPVTPDDLAPILEQIQPGDAAVIRTGCQWRKILSGPADTQHGLGLTQKWPGLRAETVDALASADVSLIATDAPGDTIPYEHRDLVHSPVHVLSEVFYGIPLIHNADFEDLADQCDESGGIAFLFCVAPLLLPGGTGSLVSPLAVV